MARFKNFSTNVQKALVDEEGYLNFSKLLVDTGLNNVETYSANEANAKIVEKFNEMLGLDETSTPRERRNAIRKNQVQIFEVIEDVIESMLVTGFTDNEFFNEFVDVRNIAMGDKNSFYVEDDSVLTVSEVSGGNHNLIRQKLGAGSTEEIKTSWYGIKIYEDFEAVVSNRINWSTFVTKVYDAIDAKVQNILYDAIMTAGNKLPAQAQFNKTGALEVGTKESFFTLLSDVAMATGREVVVMGTKAALQKLNAFADVSWASNGMKEERHALGRLATLEGGYKVVEIPQRFAKGTTAATLVDNSKLLVMPVGFEKFIKFVNEGETLVHEVSDSNTNRDMTYEYEVLVKMGVGTVLGSIFGQWTIS